MTAARDRGAGTCRNAGASGGVRPSGATNVTFARGARASSQASALILSPVTTGHGNREETTRTFLSMAFPGDSRSWF